MNATMHLFRNDVRRLRWWLAGWAAFLVGTHVWVHVTAWTQRLNLDDWSFNVVQREEVFFVAWLALLATLTALLLVPHAAEGTRLFWRTRPITARDVVRAKFLFAGLFFIALPMLVETVFWRAWVPWGRVAEFWPGMLQERAGWAALLVLVVALGGREGKHYAYCLLGLLLGFFGWMTFGEQLAMRVEAGMGEEGIWPALESAHLPGQLWEFWTKNSPGRQVTMMHTTAMVLFITFAVAAWVVVACRYLWAGWRATRLAIEGALLLAVVAAIGLSEWEEVWLEERDLAQEQTDQKELINAVKSTEVRLESARLVPRREIVEPLPGEDPRSIPKHAADLIWAVTNQPPRAVVLVSLWSLSADGKSNGVVSYQQPMLGGREMSYYVGVEARQLEAALPELAGYRVLAMRVPAWHWVELRAELVEELNRLMTAKAGIRVATLMPVTQAKRPLRQSANLWLGQAHVRLVSGSEPRLHMSLPTHVLDSYLWGPYRLSARSETPNLFVLRHPGRKEALVVDRFVTESGYGDIRAPASSRQESMTHQVSRLNDAVARHGLPPEWLADAELLCVRLKLTGHGGRKLDLENFRLEPPPGQ